MKKVTGGIRFDGIIDGQDGKDGKDGKDALAMYIEPSVWGVSSADGSVKQTSQDVRIQVMAGGKAVAMDSIAVEDMPENVASGSSANPGVAHETGSIDGGSSSGSTDVSGDTLLYRVGLGSDWHYTINSANDNLREVTKDIQNAIRYFRDNGAAFIASCGDMGDNDAGDLDGFASLYRQLAYGGAQATRNLRLFSCLGNHDNNLAHLANPEDRYTKKWINTVYGLSYVPGAGGSLAYGTEGQDGDMLWLSGALPSDYHITDIDTDSKRNTPRKCTSDYGKALTRAQAESSDYSKLSYYFSYGPKGDIFVFLSPCYGGDGFPLSGKEFINPYHIMDLDSGTADTNFGKAVEQKVISANIGYTRAANAHYNYQCYRNVDLLGLEALLNANKTKRIFIFTHYYFPHLAGGGAQDGYRYDQQNIRPNDWTLSSARSMALCGVQLYFMNWLREQNKNTVWFSGHTHWRWSDGTEDQYENFCNKNFNITAPQHSTNDVAVIANNYKRGSDKGTTGGWAVHLPSISKLSSCTPGKYTEVAGSEGAMMEVYQNHVVIRGLNFKDEGVVYKATPDPTTTLVIDSSTNGGSVDGYSPTGNAIYRLTPGVGTVYYKPSGKATVENEDFSPSGAFTAVCEKITSEGTTANPTEVTMGYSYDGTHFYTTAVGNASGKSIYNNTGLGVNGKVYFNVFRGAIIDSQGLITAGNKLFSEEISVGITQVSALPTGGLQLSADHKTATGVLTAAGAAEKVAGRVTFIASGTWNGEAMTVRGHMPLNVIPAGGNGGQGASGKDGSTVAGTAVLYKRVNSEDGVVNGRDWMNADNWPENPRNYSATGVYDGVGSTPQKPIIRGKFIIRLGYTLYDGGTSPGWKKGTPELFQTYIPQTRILTRADWEGMVGSLKCYKGDAGDDYRDLYLDDGNAVFKECRETHVASSAYDPLTDSTKWQRYEFFDALGVGLLAVVQAHIKELTVGRVETEADESGLKVQIMDGLIRVGRDSDQQYAYFGMVDGRLVLRFEYRDSGGARKFYDLGPSNTSVIDTTVADDFKAVTSLKRLSGSLISLSPLNTSEPGTATTLYVYTEGYVSTQNGGVRYNKSGGSSPSTYNGKYVTTNNRDGMELVNGYFIKGKLVANVDGTFTARQVYIKDGVATESFVNFSYANDVYTYTSGGIRKDGLQAAELG